jgi:RNA polymerase sigma-70 factor (ECF subfamily)
VKPPPSTPELLEAAHRRGRETWPGLLVERGDFEAYVRQRSAALEDVAGLQLGELYLACACARRVPGSIDALESWCAAEVNAVMRKAQATTRDELIQAVREHLFVPRPGAPALIEDYQGRGSLKGWVRVVAIRELTQIERRGRREQPVDDDALQAAVALHPDAELQYIQERYRHDFQAALSEAAAGLSARERNLLRHHYLDRLSVDQLATLYRAHRATCARWVAGARQRLMEGARARLVERLGLSRGELNSLLRAVRSHLDISLGSLLR